MIGEILLDRSYGWDSIVQLAGTYGTIELNTGFLRFGLHLFVTPQLDLSD